MYQLTPFANIPLNEQLLEHLIEYHQEVTLPRLERLWTYFRNNLPEPGKDGDNSSAPAQRIGLPTRLKADRRTSIDDRYRKETVIENDIAWRIHTLVDFMFPRQPQIISKATEAATREAIEQLLKSVIDANGGISLWQDVALLGSVYGSVDLLLDCEELFGVSSTTSNGTRSGEAAQDIVFRFGRGRPESLIRIEAVEAPRAIPLLNTQDYRELDAYIVHFERPVHAVESESLLSKLLTRRFINRNALKTQRATTTITQIYSDTHCQHYENGRLVHETRHKLGRIPVVHIQNQSLPFFYEGLSDVEPLIPLQDELNTRLSDRANRVTMQSFRMWLGKGIDGFTDRPVGPGQMWMTDNENASIEGFGGDADSPSENAHMEDLREAIDKTSGVTPAAAGHIKARVGNLTSENALRISLMGTIAKVKRKRITYGGGIASLCEMILHALDVSGRFNTKPEDRKIEIVWPDSLPIDESRRIQDALAKAELGVPKSLLRAELGYSEED